MAETNPSPDPRYPIGKYIPQPFSEKQLKEWLNDIRILPNLLENSILNLDAEKLNTPYRPGGWKIKQLVHHVADSHMHAYSRFRLGLTENNPTIKPYDQDATAALPDSETVPVNVSVTLLFALHARWYETIKDLTKAQWDRTVFHPEHRKEFSLWHLLGSYSWHGRHHVAQIEAAR